MSYKAKGFLYKKGDVETKGESGFKVRELVLSQPGEYPNKIKFQLARDNTVLIDHIGEGSEIEVEFSIKGSEKDGKVWNNLNAYAITVINAKQPATVAEDDAPF